MRLLAIDPGHTTGIAIYEDKSLEITMTVPYLGSFQDKNFFKCLYMLARPDTVLIEDIPRVKVDPKTVEIKFQYQNWFTVVGGCDIVLIQPAKWKGFTDRVEIPGQHARDAATMGKWYLESIA